MPVTAENPTLLTLSPITVPPYSARGIVQTCDPIPQAINIQRTWNGGLVNLSLPTMRKYRSIITCRDLDGPKLDGVWPGMIVTCGFAKESKFITATESAEKPQVAGSIRTEGIYTYYRMELVMMIMNYNDQFEEYPAYTNWQMELQEV